MKWKNPEFNDNEYEWDWVINIKNAQKGVYIYELLYIAL